MLSLDGRCVLSFNGEIYNWRELRSELVASGWQFKTRSDSEVLLTAWRAWGEGMLARLRGMFAFAIYDIDQRILFCARDRAGKKPFVYATGTDGFAFASEIPSLMPLAAEVRADTSLDRGAISPSRHGTIFRPVGAFGALPRGSLRGHKAEEQVIGLGVCCRSSE